MKIKAYGVHIIVIRDEVLREKNGLAIPDNATQKANKGRIISVGWLAKKTDATFKEGQLCYWNRHVGNEFDLDEIVITVLSADQLLFHDET